MNKKNLLISFSGGETSAYMTQWLWNNKQDEYNMIVVFANTGQENEETLRFVNLFSQYHKIPVHWVEAVTRVSLFGKIVKMCSEIFNMPWIGGRISTTYKLVDYFTANRDGEPFERMIQKYGIPNSQFPHCTRELKQMPIHAFAKESFREEYFTAIGIRVDEIDRMSKDRIKNGLIYPLISWQPMTKQKINFWFSMQPFRLGLKGYQGNCKWCHKKSDPKLFTIAKETPKKFSFPAKMELRYGNYMPNSRLEKLKERGEEPQYPITFFRKNRTTDDIFKQAESFDGTVADDSLKFDLHNESCEVHSECGIDN